MTWCYAWSTSLTLKSTFNAARTVLLKEITNRYLDEDGEKVGAGGESNGREGHKNPIFKHFPKEMWLHRWMHRLNNKAFWYYFKQRAPWISQWNQSQCFLLLQTKDTNQHIKHWECLSRSHYTGGYFRNFSTVHPNYFFLTKKPLNSHDIYQEYNSFCSEVIHTHYMCVQCLFIWINIHA